jgi:hypothetical protein
MRDAPVNGDHRDRRKTAGEQKRAPDYFRPALAASGFGAFAGLSTITSIHAIIISS